MMNNYTNYLQRSHAVWEAPPLPFFARKLCGKLQSGMAFLASQGSAKMPCGLLRGASLVVLLLAMAPLVFGAPVSSRQAQQVVQAWLRAGAHPLDARIGQDFASVETYNDAQGLPLYYVVYLKPSGYAIVPADDLIEPIIAFAAHGRYDPSPANPLGALVGSDLPDRMQRVRKQAGGRVEGALKKAGDKWGVLRKIEKAALGVELGIPAVSDERVTPLVQSLWNQLTVGGVACYNYYTPPNASGSAANYYCGCVATAMAQLMRFHQHPVNGVGMTSFTIYLKGVATTRSLRGGDGSGGAYLWSDMTLVPTDGVTTTNRQAIGALTHDAGVSVSMDYGDAAYGGSGANTLDAKTAFVNTFGYNNAIKGYNSGSTIGAGLNGMVNPNLDSGYPVLFGITGTPGGHAIVCDGYGYNLSTLYHHLNLGWSGTDNAWYNLPTIDTSIGTFSSVYKCVYNVYVTGSGEIISGRVTDNSGSPLSNATVTAVRSGGGTYTTNTNVRGIYAFPKVPAASTYTLSVVKAGYSFSNRSVTTGTSADLGATSGNSWAADFTNSVAPYQLDRFEWDAIASPQTVNVPFSVTITGKDNIGNVATGFSDTVSLSVSYEGGSVTVGTGIASWDMPMDTYWHDARTQVIYLSDELGGSNTISALALDVTTVPGQTMTNWTIRMKHTTLASYSEPAAWESNGWTTVYQSNQTVSATGWVNFAFSTPFTYNGTSNLIIDFSFNNSSYTSAGQCRYTDPVVYRTIKAHTDSAYGDPLTWSGSGPPEPVISTRVPNIRLSRSTSMTVTPSNSGDFVNGVWSGSIAVQPAASNVTLRADDGAGHVGTSGWFNVNDDATPPAITTQPQSRTNNPGSSASFTVTATGTAPLYYQWQKDVLAISLATNATYTINSVVSGDAGSYRCLVSNILGVVTSATATLTVNAIGNSFISILGTNGVVVTNGEAASVAKGTDFGSQTISGAPLTNTFSITNSGSDALQITGVTTSGAGAAYFTVTGMPETVAAGGASNLAVIFGRNVAGLHTAVVTIANNSTNTPYRLNFCGENGGEIGLSTTALAFAGTYGGTNPASNAFTITNLNQIGFTFTNTVSYCPGASDWLSILPANGSVAGDGAQVVTGSVNIGSLNAGVYTATNAVISANAWPNPQYVVATLTVSKANQTISFVNPGAQITTNTVGLIATSSVGLAVSFSVGSGSAQITGGTNLSFTGAGTVSIVASQAGNTNWNPAPNVTNSFTVTKASQSITFPPIGDQVANNTVALSATASSGLPATFSVASGPGEISGGTTLAFTGAGTVSVVASQAGNAIWNSAANVTDTLNVIKANQSITFPAIPDQTVTSRVTLTATAGSGLAVSYSVGSGPGTVSGDLLTFTGMGTVSIVASQAGNAIWNSAANVTNSIVVKDVSTLAAPANLAASDGTYTNKVVVTWSAVGGASGYEIWRAGVNNAGAAARLSTATQASYDDNSSAVRPATMYYYWVKAWNSVATSEFSNVDSGFCRASADPEIISGQPMVGDYDGDHKADPAIYNLSNGRLLVWLSSISYTLATPIVMFQMAAGDLPVVGDFDADRRADPGVFQRLTGSWYLWLSGSGYDRVGPLSYGVDINDSPIAADYDGDRRADPAVFNSADGGWYVWLSGADYARIGPLTTFRVAAADIPVPALFDTDRRADPAVYQAASGNWYIWLSSADYFRVGPVACGTTDEHLAVPADYDGDGRADPAAYVPSSGLWRIWLSGSDYSLIELALQ